MQPQLGLAHEAIDQKVIHEQFPSSADVDHVIFGIRIRYRAAVNHASGFVVITIRRLPWFDFHLPSCGHHLCRVIRYGKVNTRVEQLLKRRPGPFVTVEDDSHHGVFQSSHVLRRPDASNAESVIAARNHFRDVFEVIARLVHAADKNLWIYLTGRLHRFVTDHQ